MRNRNVFVLGAILGGAGAVAVALATFAGPARVARAAEMMQPPPPPPSVGAKVDRDQFALSASSLTRADLLACRNTDAAPRAPRAITTAEFAKALNGVWVAKNRSVHGIPVEMDTAYYIQVGPDGGQAVLIDRNNLRQGVFARALRSTVAAKQVAQPLMQTFVNCRYDFLDQYVKVSDTVPVQTLLTATGTKLVQAAGAKPPTLEQAWRAIVDSGYFSKRSGVGANARLGDGKRVATKFNGLKVTEADIEAGRAPGNEYLLPMCVGGFFKMKLNSTPGPAGMPAVRLSIEAEYAGTGVNLNPDTVTRGTEAGTFMGEGDSFVAAGAGAYATSGCGDKNGLTDPGMIFERYVIGM
jgi:hypothetical protein